MHIEITPEYLASQGLNETFPDRFWKKVVKTESCWLWTGATNGLGYGKIMARKDGRKSHVALAHRAAWILVIGPIQDGLFVCHNCPGGDNPSCVNPAHMFLGTHSDNLQDASRKGRMPIGSRHKGASLSECDVRRIRDMYAAGGVTMKDIGAMFNVHTPTIYRAIRRICWKHVT